MVSETIPSTKISEIKFRKGYIFFLFIIIGLANLLTGYVQNAPNLVKSSVIEEYFVATGWMNQNQALQLISLLGLGVLLMAILAGFFKALQDRVGRRLIFMIVMLGLGLSSLIMIIAKNYWIYYAGSLALIFFFSTDMQVMYINEDAPENKRSKYLSYAGIISIVGVLIVPLIRSFTMVDSNTNWRPVLYPLVILGVVLFVLSLFFLKETRAYSILKQERAARKAEIGKADKALSIREAFKALRANSNWKQIKWIILMGLFLVPFWMVNTDYREVFMDQTGIALRDRNLVMTIGIIAQSATILFSGFLGDRFGRKPAIIINAGIMLVSLVLEYFAMWVAPTSSAKLLLLVIAGITQGMRIGAFFNVNILKNLMLIESTPVYLRGNALAIQNTFTGLLLIPFVFLTTIMIGFFPGNVGMVIMVLGIPVALLLLLGAFFKLKETLHIDTAI